MYALLFLLPRDMRAYQQYILTERNQKHLRPCMQLLSLFNLVISFGYQRVDITIISARGDNSWSNVERCPVT